MYDVELQQQARALGDPTRHRLFRYIAAAPGPVGVAELTEFVRLNHNAVRQHLVVLKDAGLVTEELEARSRPGRPRLLYRLDPEVAGRWGTTSAYAWLARLLGDALRQHEDARQAGHREGQRLGVELAGRGDGLDLLEADMTSRGFRPSRVERGQQAEFVLGRCPFVDVAESDPATVCQLHLGLAEGLAEGLGDLEVERLVARNARRAGCRLHVRRLPAGAATGD